MGLARGHDFLLGHPGSKALVITVELCSLTFMYEDTSVQNFIGLALFGDAAAAAVLADGGDGPSITASRSTTWPEHASAAGWTILDEGMQVVFGRSCRTSLVNWLVMIFVISSKKTAPRCPRSTTSCSIRVV